MNDWREDAERGWAALSWVGEAQWFAKRGSKAMGGRLRSLDTLLGTIRNAEALGWNLYLAANPTKYQPAKKKASREDILWWRYIVVDLDPTEAALNPPDPAEGIAQWLTMGHRIFSGRGYQYWLPMEPHTRPSSDSERMMSGFLRALDTTTESWCPGWQVDTTCSDLARVVRCPGSINQKTGRRSTYERRADARCAIRPDQLAEFMAPRAEIVPPVPVERMNLLGVLPHLNVRARTFVLGGAETPGRHSACFATCKTLQELGVPSQHALKMLAFGASQCLPALPLADVRKIMMQVYKEV